jgi:hypothetical protein
MFMTFKLPKEHLGKIMVMRRGDWKKHSKYYVYDHPELPVPDEKGTTAFAKPKVVAEITLFAD